MREADEGDAVVTARLRTVFEPRPQADHPANGRPQVSADGTAPALADLGPHGPADRGHRADQDGTRSAFEDRTPLAWTDLVPGWPEDVELDRGDAPRLAPVTTSSTAPIDPSAWAGIRPAWGPADPAPDPPAGDSLSGAFSAPARVFGAFDPGRRGAKALAVVAAAVVVIAAFFAWRARPRVTPVPPGPLVAESPAAPAPSAGGEVVVSVAGKVGKPGLVRLPPGARVADAISAAGGARPGVDVALLNPARKLVDGELILVGVTPPPGAPATRAGGGVPGGPVNLNAATLADLDTLPGVGPVLAQRILDARDAQGGFQAVSDLRKVDGIGQSRYEQLKDLVTV